MMTENVNLNSEFQKLKGEKKICFSKLTILKAIPSPVLV